VNGNLLTNPTKLKNGMFGLIKTYLNIYEEWSKKYAENILLIEDDSLFVDNFNEKIEDYVNNVPSDWDILYFGANHNYHIGKKTIKINEKCIKLNNSYSAHCVLLKKKVFGGQLQLNNLACHQHCQSFCLHCLRADIHSCLGES
jgi:GR25 family glycosyltransferase involved in LPS biosynthesis